MDNENERKLRKLSKEKGTRSAEMFMAKLGEGRKFLDALNTPVGQELMSDLSTSFDNGLQKLMSMSVKSCSDCPILLLLLELRQTHALLKKMESKILSFEERHNKYMEL